MEEKWDITARSIKKFQDGPKATGGPCGVPTRASYTVEAVCSLLSKKTRNLQENAENHFRVNHHAEQCMKALWEIRVQRRGSIT